MNSLCKKVIAVAMLAVIVFGMTTCEKEKVEVPTVKVFEGAITLNYTGASVSAEIIDQGGAEVKSRGFAYGKSGGKQDTVFCGNGAGVFSAELTGLEPNTIYTYEAFGRNAGGFGLSGKVTFTTMEQTAPKVKTLEVVEVTTTTAVCKGKVLEEGGAPVTKRGVCWGKKYNPTIEDDHVVSGEGMGEYLCNLSDLEPNTTYFVRAYAINSKGTAYGEELEFNTEAVFTIVLTADPQEGGAVEAVEDGPFVDGDNCTVKATPSEGYTFVNWTEGGEEVSTNASYTFTVHGNRNLVAHFTLNGYMVTVSADPANGGQVTGNGNYSHGQSCTVTASPAEGYSFVNWTENNEVISGAGASYTFPVQSDRVLVAHFSQQSYTVSVSADPTNGGEVSGAGNYTHGQTCTVTATPANGYAFTKWKEDGTDVSDNASYSFTVGGNRTLVAHFSQENYTVTVSADPSNGGSAVVSGGGHFTYGQTCTVTATASSGYHFTNWTENGEIVTGAASPYTFTVQGSRTLVAHFSQQTYMVSVSAEPAEGGTVTGGGTYSQGQSCTVHASANTGYTFLKWTENGNQVSTLSDYPFNVTANRNLVAHFQGSSYTINVSANPTNGGTVTGGGTYSYNQNCTITATAATGYQFVKWTKNGTQVSTNPTFSFHVTASASYVAHFQIASCTISVSANPSNGGTVTGGGNHNYGQSCTISATPATGYQFVKWTKNGVQVSQNPSYTFTVTESASYVAHFQTASYTISVSASPSVGGIVSGGGTYSYGQSCTVHASANSGYAFINWTVNGTQVSTNANYTFTVTGNRSLVAHFQAQTQVPPGAINGLFSVSATQQVYFSQGNLQYKASTNTWRFATNQWDYVGSANSNISQNYSNWIDLFGWGTSGWYCDNTYYRPWDSDNSSGSLYGPPGQYNLTGTYSNSDWGRYNAISNGGNQANQWRTLTHEEWAYVFNTRTTSSGIRYAKAQVNNVNGVILLPDNWSTSTYSLSSTNQSGANFTSNVIGSSQWSILENAGAVFLPAAGYRNGTSVGSVGSSGSYWSASYYNADCAWIVYFNSSSLDTDDNGGRYGGLSVRLVRSAQ